MNKLLLLLEFFNLKAKRTTQFDHEDKKWDGKIRRRCLSRHQNPGVFRLSFLKPWKQSWTEYNLEPTT